MHALSNLFNIVLEKIMQETRHDHHTPIYNGGKHISNLKFTYDIDLIRQQNR
ncbi:hypothetical protein DPMN_014376 [Dreissena polymorpha]|uniref:Uncharacterized protein n=1 Tax=Dreissena polymorpha TaxID=45954 RepID=A0A9D4N765_DREPO|nr:hypothetical protein DPMN_014376 [Dreissena polymorpha]